MEQNESIKSLSQAELRSQFSAKRRALSAEERAARSSKISALIDELLRVKQPKLVASYVAIQGEPQLSLASGSFDICYPRVEGEELAFYKTPASSEHFIQSSLRVPEPSPEQSERVELGADDVVLVPGVVFNFKGQRIGMGKGFYDRFLSRVSCVAWGVGYGFQLLTQEWSAQNWDRKVDLVVTENFALDLKL